MTCKKCLRQIDLEVDPSYFTVTTKLVRTNQPEDKGQPEVEDYLCMLCGNPGWRKATGQPKDTFVYKGRNDPAHNPA